MAAMPEIDKTDLDGRKLVITHAKLWFENPREWCRDLNGSSYVTCIFLLLGWDRYPYCGLLDKQILNNRSCCTDHDWNKILLEVL